MPARSKARCLTGVETQCTGCSGNGTKASTAVAPPRPPASGERVSTRVNQPWAEGGGRGQRNRRWAGLRARQCLRPALNCVRAIGPSSIHLSIAQTHSLAYQQDLSWAGRSCVLNPRTKPLLIHGHTIFQSTHIIPVPILGTKKEYW